MCALQKCSDRFDLCVFLQLRQIKIKKNTNQYSDGTGNHNACGHEPDVRACHSKMASFSSTTYNTSVIQVFDKMYNRLVRVHY